MESSFQPFFENWKRCRDCVHLSVKICIQNVILRVSRRKNSKMFSCEFWFLVFSAKCLSKCPCFTKLFLLWKVSGCLSALTHHSFCKTHHLKCLTIFWIHPCLDNCSVVFTVTVTPRYVQHQTNSKFWHIENSVYLGICRQIQAYSALLTHIHAYWEIIRAHSSLFIIFSTQGNSYVLTQLCHILPLAFLKPEAYSKL